MNTRIAKLLGSCLGCFVGIAQAHSVTAGKTPQPEDGYPTASISNGAVTAKLLIPDVRNGYYQGFRFDWSGSVVSLEAGGHSYFGQWFPRRDLTRQDSIFGPVEVYGPLNYSESKPGETFVKIGVGVLKHLDTRPYSPGAAYEFVDHGKWSTRKGKDFVEFKHELRDPRSGYAYIYTKTIRLTPGKPQMTISHKLKNTGVKPIETNVYNHGFFMLDGQPSGPGLTVKFPFQIKGSTDMKGFAEVRGDEIIFRKELQNNLVPGGAQGRLGPEAAATPVEGFSADPKDFNIAIEDSKTGAGVRYSGDQPLSRVSFWSIRSVVCPEAFVDVRVTPGNETSWKLTYDFYSVPKTSAQSRE